MRWRSLSSRRSLHSSGRLRRPRCSAVGTIDRVEEVVERCAFDDVANLVYWRGPDIAFAIIFKSHTVLLHDTPINAVQDRTISDLMLAEIGKEQIQVPRDVGLRQHVNNPA
ncbi:hypothetical protein KC322_g92 [Hortaea werneckii]|nr:hypothetical protein KC322_g92 [Hortaea werneckii]